MAKRTREHTVKERRAKKQEKKQAAAAARRANAADGTLSAQEAADETRNG